MILLVLPLLWTYQQIRRARGRTESVCPTCRYNLTANTSGVCPECGTAVAGEMANVWPWFPPAVAAGKIGGWVSKERYWTMRDRVVGIGGAPSAVPPFGCSRSRESPPIAG